MFEHLLRAARGGGLFLVCATLPTLACSAGDVEREEATASTAEALAACRTTSLVANTTYNGNSTSIQTSTVTFTPAAQIAVPASVPVSIGGAGNGDAQLTITWNDATTVCHYTGAGGAQYLFASCSPAQAAGSVVSAGQVALRVNSGNRSDPAHKTQATLVVTEVAGCAGPADAGSDARTDAKADASADASADAHDAGSDARTDAAADASKVDAASGCTAASCDDRDPCTTDKCTAGTCGHAPALAGTSCSDGNACNGSETCDGSGQCLAAKAPIVDDGNPCTADACDAVSGVSHAPVATGASCSDGNACNGVEACNGAGQCLASAAPVVDDGDPCTVDRCDPASGVVHDPAAAAGLACEDGNACNGGEACDGRGHCQTASAPPIVDDGDPCTIDRCDAARGVLRDPAPAGTACSDGDACDGDEACDATGACRAGAAPAVDDGDACTTDRCDPALGVVHEAVTSDACVGAETAWVAASLGRPSPRDGAAAAFDVVSKRVLLFGGENAGAALGDTWTLDGAARAWTPGDAAGPAPRAGAAFAFDPERRTLVVFGGAARGALGDGYLGDTWEYDVAAKRWSLAAREGGGPAARAYASMAFDPAGHRVVLVGGASPMSAGEVDAAWTWDGARWARQAIGGSAPAPRYGAPMTWSAPRGRFVLFGGASAETPRAGAALGDTWELDAAAWTWAAIAAPAPPPRTGHAMAFDAARGRVVLFGGTGVDAGNLGDTWEYDGAWTARDTGAAPPARAGHAMVFDGARGKTVLFGGLRYSETGRSTPGFDDTWEYDGASGAWSIASDDVAPAALGSGAVLDEARGVIVARGDEAVPSMWEADAATLRFVATDAFAGSDDFGAALRGALGAPVGPQPLAYARSRARTLLVTRGAGPDLLGHAAATPAGVWEWDGARWAKRACSGGPLARERASVAYDGARDRVLLFGGYVATSSVAGPGPQSDLWELDPAACAWSQRPLAGGPPARLDALAAWDPARATLVVFGGASDVASSSPTYLTDTWELDTAAGTWARRATGGPPARTGAAMAYDARRARVVLAGGFPVGSSEPSRDVWEYDGGSGAWTQVTSAPVGEAGGSLVFDAARGGVVLLGGRDARGHAVGAWEWDGAAWASHATAASPGARSGAAAAWSARAQAAILFGGVAGNGDDELLRDTWLWKGGAWARAGLARPEALQHRRAGTDASGDLPDARAGHALAATSDGHALLFGGEGESGLLGDTWTFDLATLAWSAVVTPGQPPARTGHAMVATDTGYFLFGGQSDAGPLGDAWTADANGAWSGAFPTSNALPSPRAAHALAFDPSRRVVVLFGGRGASGPLGDTWEWSPDARTWTQRSPSTPPPARFGHQLAFDAARGRVLLTGGTGAGPGTASSEVWEYAGASGEWTLRAPATALAPRAGHVAFFDDAAHALVVFGGLAHRSAASVVTHGDTWTLARAGARDATPPRYPDAASCASAGDCASGHCVDGVCCESACGGQCAACNAQGSEGRCVAVAGAVRGKRTPCADVAACPLACDGSDATSCHSDSGRVCGAATCAGGASRGAARCDARGTCAPGLAHACTALACSGATCACASDADCGGDPGVFCGGPGGALACRPYAVVSSLSLDDPSPPGWGSTTVRASSDGTVDPTYRFTYSAPAPGSQSYGWWQCQGAPTCSISLPPGEWRVRVEVTDRYSTRAFDDAREIAVTTR